MTSLNDPLFLHKNGVKQDYLNENKQASMVKALDNGGQYYPTDTSGVIDEWAAIAMQQDNYWQQKMEEEKSNRRLRQKQYSLDLDLQRKLKGGDLEDKDKQRRELENKLKRIDDLEKYQQLGKAEALKREQDEMLKWAKQAKKQKDADREREKQEYLGFCQKTEAKMRSKQDALAEYYRQLDDQMRGNYDQHHKMAYNPEQEKLAKLQGIEDKNHLNFLRKQAQNDDNGLMNRLKNNQLMNAENDKMLKKREYEKELERMKQREDEINARGENGAFQIGQEVDMDAQRQRKNLYKQTLLYQQAMNEHNKHNFGKMTYAEKRLNRHDLKAYREKKPQIHALAPGINNIETMSKSPGTLGKGSMAGDLGQMPFTTRYDANKSSYPYKPQLSQTYRGMSTAQSMQQLPDMGTIHDNRANLYGGGRRESVLQTSARNNLQL